MQAYHFTHLTFTGMEESRKKQRFRVFEERAYSHFGVPLYFRFVYDSFPLMASFGFHVRFTSASFSLHFHLISAPFAPPPLRSITVSFTFWFASCPPHSLACRFMSFHFMSASFLLDISFICDALAPCFPGICAISVPSLLSFVFSALSTGFALRRFASVFARPSVRRAGCSS